MEQQEGSPWFWKLFGGAIISTVVILLGIILNSLYGSVIATKAEFAIEISKMRDEITQIKTNLASINEFKDSTKDKTSSLEAAIKERTAYSESNVAIMRDKDKEHDAAIVELRERVLRLEEKLKAATQQP